MKLNIQFPDDVLVKVAIQLRLIPCVCRVYLDGRFEVYFQMPLFEADGLMSEFDMSDLGARLSTLGGGNLAHYCPAMVSLERISDEVYSVTELHFFQRSSGWVRLIEEGEWVAIQPQNYEGY